MPTLIRWNARVCAAWINTVVCTLQCLLGFASVAHAQCGVGWALAAGDGPGAYEICYDESRARTVLFSGTTTYEWDGTTWETVAISGPPDRGAGAMVYDPIGQRCLLFGGYSIQGARKDLWSWNGVRWTYLSAGPSDASGRGDFAMAFDRGRNRLVVHGGWPGGGQLLSDTLEWDPTSNTWQGWASSPIGNRYAHRMAYDEARGEIILHGGYYFTNKNDTWRWNGSTWSLASTSGPARYVFGMTYDSGRSQLVLHGGTTCCGEVEYTQTYVWNGIAWSQCAQQGPARGYMNIAYDRAREVIVLPGGMGSTPAGRAYVPETWELAMARRVPTDYPTIQSAVDASVDGDTVLVDPGIYVESVNLRGKAITVRSLVVGGASVLAPQDARSFVAVSGEPSAMRVVGFRIGRADSWGGGAATTSSSVVFENCTFEGCRNHTGGGALVSGGSPSFIRCHFTDCIVDGAGGGLYGGGGAIRSVGGSVTIDYCAFDNCCGAQGRIMMQEGGGSSVMRHSTLRGIEGIAWSWIYNVSSSFTIEDSVFDSMEGAALFGWSPYTVRRCTFRNITGYSVMDMRFGQQIVDSCRFEQCHVVYMFAVTYSGTYALGNSTFCDCSTPTFQAGWSDLGGNVFNATCPCKQDSDADGTPDCDDGCPFNPALTAPIAYYGDADADGYGFGSATMSCSGVAGSVTNNADCDDTNGAVHPGAFEVCNGVDDDCAYGADDGLRFNDYYADNDGDTYGAGRPASACAPIEGRVTNNADCDDFNASVYPSAAESCNGIDDNCDGSVDEGVMNTYYLDSDCDGYASGPAILACIQPPCSSPRLSGDCNDSNAAIHPDAPELCDGFDNNCNGTIDEGACAAIATQWRTEDGGNGHWYAARNASTPISWNTASQLAQASGGYLATATSAGENNFIIHSIIPNLGSYPGFGPILGGRFVNGAWAWVTGEPWSFTAWAPGEPSFPTFEPFLHYQLPTYGWNDYDGTPAGYGAPFQTYIIEFDADCNNDGLVDYGQILAGELADANANNIPDCCEGGGNCPGAPVQWRVEDGGNGHWYRRVDHALAWQAAKLESEALGGHLVTVTSSAEWQFLKSTLPVAECWAGASQAPSNPGYAEPAGGWVWVTGEPFVVEPYVSLDDCPAGPPAGCNCGSGAQDALVFTGCCANVLDDIQDGSPDDCTYYPGDEPDAYIIEWSSDCNNDGVVDFGQLLDGTIVDANQNHIPDECECTGDFNHDGYVSSSDLSLLLISWGGATPSIADINGDGEVNAADMTLLLAHWGVCTQ